MLADLLTGIFASGDPDTASRKQKIAAVLAIFLALIVCAVGGYLHLTR
jgi:hypothetical protein